MSLDQLSKLLGVCAIVAVLLTLGGMQRVDMLHRSVFEPAFPQKISSYIEVRGFPFAWWIRRTQKEVVSARLTDRFLVTPFLESMMVNFLVALALGAGCLKLWSLRSRSRTA